MTPFDQFADLDARLVAYLATRADAALAAAVPLDEMVERLERRVGQGGPRSSAATLAPHRFARSWVWIALAAAALIALLAGALLVGSRPRYTVAPDLPHHDGSLIVSLGLGFLAVDPTTGASSTFHASGRSLAWSPDGTRLASIYDGALWVEDMVTTKSTRVTSCCGTNDVAWPHPTVSWSPDGARLAFADDGELYTVRVDGSQRTQVTHLGGASVASSPAWSPDGTRLAYAASGPGDTGAQRWLMTTRFDGTGSVPLSDAAGEQRAGFFPSGPVWAPNGSHLAYLSGSFPVQLITVQSDGSDRRIVFSVARCCVTDWGDLAWSPDGTKLATVLLGSDNHTWSLYVMGASGANVVELAKGINVGGPAWRPVP